MGEKDNMPNDMVKYVKPILALTSLKIGKGIDQCHSSNTKRVYSPYFVDRIGSGSKATATQTEA
jgi:hypothetical protein